jgi:hypothetical protein
MLTPDCVRLLGSSYLNPQEYLTLARTCKALYRIISSDPIWSKNPVFIIAQLKINRLSNFTSERIDNCTHFYDKSKNCVLMYEANKCLLVGYNLALIIQPYWIQAIDLTNVSSCKAIKRSSKDLIDLMRDKRIARLIS